MKSTRALAGALARARFVDDAAQIGDAGADRRHALEMRAGRPRDDLRQRRLSAAGRPPQDHRRHGVALDRARAARGPAPAGRSWPTNSSSVRGRMRAASGISRSERTRTASPPARLSALTARRCGEPTGWVKPFFGILSGFGVANAAVNFARELHRDVALRVSDPGVRVVETPCARSCCACPATMCTVPSSKQVCASRR